MDKLIETTLSAGLDPHARTPLQEQLHERLRTAILAATLPASTRLPASRQLATLLGISRNTVLAAYEQLIAEGYLETKRGAGTFISPDLPDAFTSVLPHGPSIKLSLPQSINSHEEIQSDYSLLSGAPAFDQFPKKIWARLTSRAWRTAGKEILQHDDLAGYIPLRTALAKYLQASRNIVASPDQILIFSGLQQGFKLTAECLLDATSAVILENPGYGGMFQAAQTLQQKTLFIPVDRQGATVPKTTDRTILVISPSRQYPLGITMPLSRRLELLEWAADTDSLILEDDYDSEFRYSGKPLNSLQGIDGGERVIYGGSFSKTVFPALRLGYLVLPKQYVGRVLAHRAAADSYPSIVPQIALAEFMGSGHFAKHIRKLRKVHIRRQRLFTESFEAHLGHLFTLDASDAGLHIIAQPKKPLRRLEDHKLAAIAKSVSIGAAPLSASYRSGVTAKQGLLIGFANLEDTLIDPALKKFSIALQEEIG